VAICDQLEDPETAKGIVKRGVTRILSPGMVYDPESLSAEAANYVASLDESTISFIEASTGECFYYHVSSAQDIYEVLQLTRPVEIVLTAAQKAKVIKEDSTKSQATTQGLDQLRTYLNQTLTTIFEESHDTKMFGPLPEHFLNVPTSSRRLLHYASHMQGSQILATLKPFVLRSLKENLSLGENTLKHLEVFASYRGEDRGSLYYAVNRTKTSAGARKLKNWLQMPLLHRDKIIERQNQVAEWASKPADLKILRQTLGQMGDIERRLTKISYTNCQVRDVVALKQSLEIGLAINPLCQGYEIGHVRIKDSAGATSAAATATVESLVKQIQQTLVDDVPLQTKSGGYIRNGVDPELDQLITLSENGQKLLLELEAREKEATQISSLKIRYNNVFGYYIEVTNTHKDKVPSHYKRKQTLANAERYVTQELHDLETKILSSRDRRIQLEEKIFQDLRSLILKHGATILALADQWSELDVLSSLAWLALEQKYVRPTFHDSMAVQIEGSRHPVIEQEVKKTFVPNAIELSAGECLLLTGPNMAGKSTLMRQVAVTVLLAQMGSFVPAKKATLPIFEKIFTRIGASDSLSEGLSTFMVEMRETAEMLKSATPATLVILDEVGRGTSTYDGMSLAQAILEYLVTQIRCVTFFATHYHEITELDRVHPQIRNAHMGIYEKGQDIHFLYTLKPGPANKSYGIHVARLAGLPAGVISRAADLLSAHEASVRGEPQGDQLELLQAHTQNKTEQLHTRYTIRPARTDNDKAIHALVEKIKAFRTNEVTPLQALQQISDWQASLPQDMGLN
jgi:DNA mismatch repair protein MutS